jgi:hypothetical protein
MEVMFNAALYIFEKSKKPRFCPKKFWDAMLFRYGAGTGTGTGTGTVKLRFCNTVPQSFIFN